MQIYIERKVRLAVFLYKVKLSVFVSAKLVSNYIKQARCN